MKTVWKYLLNNTNGPTYHTISKISKTLRKFQLLTNIGNVDIDAINASLCLFRLYSDRRYI